MGSNYARSPYGAHGEPLYDTASPSPTPSPRHHFYYPSVQRTSSQRQGPIPRPTTAMPRGMDGHPGHSRGFSQDYGFGSPRYTSRGEYATANGGRVPVEKDPGYASPMYFDQPARPQTRVRRSSTSVPQRPATVAPQAAKRRPPKEPSPSRVATDADAKRHRIPAGYSLKNWDPSEEPIVLLGSVFDSNSLGKWIFDWTVHEQGGAGSTPISQVAGDLWLLLINLAGKVKRAEECLPRIRTKENREIVNDFIESGERLMDRFRKLLKTCEKPMLRAGKNRSTQLGSNAGIEFVKTLFGHEREMVSTEKFMQSVRLWDLRFEANVEDILANPTQ